MPDKQEMRAKARELLNSEIGDRIKAETGLRGGYTRKDDSDRSGRRVPTPENARSPNIVRRAREAGYSNQEVNEAYETAAAQRPRAQVGKLGGGYERQSKIGPMTEDTRRQTRRGVRGEAPKFADGGKVRGDGICQRGRTKGRMV